ncbi:hypothetical protein DL89DRAFT_124394 [Linderina pennispora]|uniref:Uncharacterized protein n=1 Tax=Linderina pennispora TaxID=61395 RepID=A0A1Y1WDW7_9FUNG|nr:uncharacterized protein DL89DRAFT_124394 [Linderina pennispora]ORX71364.1 hypothetical protein DL89DRAFT_124394 [Linderina pennispora]
MTRKSARLGSIWPVVQIRPWAAAAIKTAMLLSTTAGPGESRRVESRTYILLALFAHLHIESNTIPPHLFPL